MRIPVLAKPGAAHPDKEARHGEPLTFGVPLPRGLVKDVAGWTWVSPGTAPKPVQARALDAWPDGSVRWALVDVQADVDAGLSGEFSIETGAAGVAEISGEAIAITESAGTIAVDTSSARFQIRAGGAFPFDSAEVDGASALDAAVSGLTITDAAGVAHRATVEQAEVEERGRLRSVVRIDGKARLDGARVLHLEARVHFYAGLRAV